MNDAVLYKKEDGVAVITLNRPERLNSVTAEIRAGLKEKMDDACKDDEVNVIILTGQEEDSVREQTWTVWQLPAKESQEKISKQKKGIMLQITLKVLREVLATSPPYPNQLLQR